MTAFVPLVAGNWLVPLHVHLQSGLGGEAARARGAEQLHEELPLCPCEDDQDESKSVLNTSLLG